MPLRLIAAACAALAMVGLSACDATSGPTSTGEPTDHRVTVMGEGQVEGVPDTVTIDAAIEFTAPDVTNAMNQTNDRTTAVINALANSGIPRQDITTAGMTLQQQFGPDGAVPTGYRASTNLNVKVRPVDRAGAAISLIASTGADATRINSVNLSIQDDSQLVRDARSRAFDDAKQRAQQYAQLSGLSLGNVISINEGQGEATPPTPTRFPRAEALAPAPLEPGQQSVRFRVTVIWELT